MFICILMYQEVFLKTNFDVLTCTITQLNYSKGLR